LASESRGLAAPVGFDLAADTPVTLTQASQLVTIINHETPGPGPGPNYSG
jgi:hypothetical protein